METSYGQVDSAYLRPETAQGIFVNFPELYRVHKAQGGQFPFGVGQIGKSFRNEISPRDFLFRSREFEQMELEFFCHANDADASFKRYVSQCTGFLRNYGIKEASMRLKHYNGQGIAHYAKDCVDIEFKFPFGWGELWGIAHRGTYDLTTHHKCTGVKGFYVREADLKSQEEREALLEKKREENAALAASVDVDQSTEKKPTSELKSNSQNALAAEYQVDPYIPTVIEPAVGLDRLFLAFLVDAYTHQAIIKDSQTQLSNVHESGSVSSKSTPESAESKASGESRVVLKLHPKIAPFQVAILPISKKKKLVDICDSLRRDIIAHVNVDISISQSIGKRYRKHDEIGTLWCCCVDFETESTNTLTVRHRDTMEQKRVEIGTFVRWIRQNPVDWNELVHINLPASTTAQ
jgi:glycyl-tRNA synthetase